ncbi:hypothetical protein [Humibacillus xanthopallidus]|uniref:hypothetical protein n=1 Tax=Humibacillus xanthopallidus TaxID=412689 RepID=UPI00384C2561
MTPQGGSTVSSSPVLSWGRVAEATTYDVEVASSSSFTTPVFTKTTTNRHIVPTVQLPDGAVYWRVRANGPAGASAWALAGITVSATLPPTPTAPGNGGPALAQPDEPPLLTWTAVKAAVSYQVEVDPDGDFVGAASYSTKTTSLVVPDPKADGTYNWRVRALLSNGLYTAFSSPWSFTVGALKQVQTLTPAENTAVEDVFLSWSPVKGAKTYELQVSTDQDFNTIIDTRVNIKGTRYSPATTYLNDQYYWRVRARNNLGETIDWVAVTPLKNFQRHWPDKPTLVYPPSTVSPPVGDDFYYQWTPVEHATRYQLDVSTDPNFSTFVSCFTPQTTYAAGYFDLAAYKCTPGQGTVTYWRVRALDEPANVQGIYSTIGTFVYASAAVLRLSPSNGSTVGTPTLRWQAAQDAEKYRVTLTDGSGRTTTADTYALSWSPKTTALDPADGPFAWTVQSIDANGFVSPKYPNWTFNLSPVAGTGSAPDPSAPAPGAAPTTRFPALTWTPVANAAYYRVDVGVHGSGFFFADSHAPLLSDKHPYASATDTGKTLMAAGQYDWQVEAFTSGNVSLGRGSLGTFTIADLSPVAGRRLALDGTGLDQTTGCTAYLDAPTLPRACDGVPSTPILDWDPVPGSAYYMVYLARDRELTNLVYTNVPVTVSTRWNPTSAITPSALPDSQAGQAYYWYVRPCKADGVCAPDPVSTASAATNSFSKLSPEISLTSPTHGGSVSNQAVFTWQDYLATNAATTFGATSERSNQSAKQYRVQVATADSFAAPIDTQLVDQPTYTAWDKTYPEGTLYWRVQAVDAAGNGLQWSRTFSFVKTSPAPALTAPKGAIGTLTQACPTIGSSGCTSGTSPFTWAATDYAGSYQLEVYKNDDINWSSTNRVVNVLSKQAAYAHTTPLPASSAAYVWRVARLDADGRAGQWSASGRFFARGAVPTLTAPGAGAIVNGYGAYFSWSETPGAVTYRFERRTAGGASTTEKVPTAAQAYAPTAVMATGSWEWRVAALDVAGTEIGASDWRSFSVDNNRGSYTAVSPRRFLDTRTGLGAAKAKVGAGRTINVVIPGLPAAVSSVVLNVTATNVTATGHVIIWPYGQARPTTSNLNFTAGKTVPNMVTVRVGSGGRVSLYNSAGTSDLIADLSGYFVPDLGSGFTPVAPTRVLDTRSGVGGHSGTVGSGQTITLTVPGIPSGTKAIVLNLTVTAPSTGGYLSVHPYGSPRPTVSSVNFTKGQTVPNLVTAAVDGSGRVSIYNSSGTTHIIADLAGYYALGQGGEFAGINPTRVMDTRSGVGVAKGKITGGSTKTLTIPGLPAGTTAVAINVTVAAPTSGGFLTVHPSDAPRSSASNLNFTAGQTIANMVVVKVGAGGKVSFYNSNGATDVIADLAGSYSG